MEISISVEELRKKKLFIATPCYGGNANGLYVKSILDLQALFNYYGVETRFSFLFNESLVQRARNYLSAEFLRSGFSHMMFIDSDIGFDPQDVIAMMAMDKELSGGLYPKKSISWRNIHNGSIKNKDNPNFDPGELEALVGDYVFNPVPGTTNFKVTEPIEVMEIGTGFMMIKREVFDKMAESYPHTLYKPDHAGQPGFDGSVYINSFFDCEIDPDSHRYLSEDYLFCRRWRDIGGQVWAYPWMKLSHCGTYTFQGNMTKIAELVGTMG